MLLPCSCRKISAAEASLLPRQLNAGQWRTRKISSRWKRNDLSYRELKITRACSRLWFRDPKSYLKHERTLWTRALNNHLYGGSSVCIFHFPVSTPVGFPAFNQHHVGLKLQTKVTVWISSEWDLDLNFHGQHRAPPTRFGASVWHGWCYLDSDMWRKHSCKLTDLLTLGSWVH